MNYKTEEELLNELRILSEKYSSNEKVQKEVQKGLQYRYKFQGSELRDILRYQLYKANKCIKFQSQLNKPIYEGPVLIDNTVKKEKCTGYTIINVTLFEGNEIEANLIDANTINAKRINADVINATNVQADTINADIKNITSSKSKHL